MNLPLSILLVIALSITTVHCLQADGTGSGDFPKVVKSEPVADLNALFDNKNGWIGADGCYSVVTAPNRVIWLYSDTILGKVNDGRRTEPVMVNNSVGVQTGIGKDATVRFVTGATASGKPAAIFTPADGKGWFWVHAPILVNEKLYVFLAHMEKSSDPGVFGFKQIGEVLAIIDNPNADPQQWHVEQHNVPFGAYGDEICQCWGSAAMQVADKIFIYGYAEKEKGLGKRQMVVAQAPAAQFADFTTWRFWTGTAWSESPADASSAFGGFATEFSVTPLPGAKGYVAVYTEDGLSDRILARCADEPQGPWSLPTLLYTSPEMKKDKGVFCYSGRAHPWAATGNELVLTYCQNTWEFKHVFEDDSIYRPKFVRVKLEAK